MTQEGGRPPISPDGRMWWDGASWQPLYSPDGKLRWDGRQWVAVAEEAPSPATALEPPSGPVTPSGAPAPPDWLAQGQQVPRSHLDLADTPAQPAQAGPASAPGFPIWQQVRPSPFDLNLPRRTTGLIAAGVIVLILGTLWGYNQFFVHHDPPADVLVANTIQLAYKPGDVQRIHVLQKQTGRLTVPNGQSVDQYSQVDAIEDWRVIEVASNGTATLGVKFETFSGQINGQNIAVNLRNAKEMQLVISPDGRVVSGGTNGTAGGKSTNSVPGTDQFFSILPSKDVHVGDTWGKDWQRDNPMGTGKVHYRTENKFLRFDYLPNGPAAVIETSTRLPIDEALNLKLLDQLLGIDNPGTPVDATVSYKGNADAHIISYVSTADRLVEKSLVVANFDFDMTFQGFPDTPPYAPLKGTFHFGGHQDADLEWLTTTSASPSPAAH